jgi:hypothetical protein
LILLISTQASRGAEFTFQNLAKNSFSYTTRTEFHAVYFPVRVFTQLIFLVIQFGDLYLTEKVNFCSINVAR